ncbi:MAG: hypothetical protein KGQ41_00505 [Alphaproteobacteria bacterium]|nr:hypothetical protein [Alphaproteobacteria bacterium]
MKRAIIGGAFMLAAAIPQPAQAQRLSVPAGVTPLQYDRDIPIVSAQGFQVATMEIKNLDDVRSWLQMKRRGQPLPANAAMRVNYYLAANSGLDKQAPAFVIYAPDIAPARVQQTGPQACAAYFNTRFDYQTNSSETEADIFLGTAGSMLEALSRYGCIIVHNQRHIREGRIPVLNKP